MDHCEVEKRKTNPRERANIFSVLTFTYTRGLFRRALKEDLDEKDLYQVLRQIGSRKCGDGLEKQWILENKRKKAPPSIYHLMWKRFGWRYLFIGFVHLIWRSINSVVEPRVVSKLISYFKVGQTEITKNDAYNYAAVILILNVVNCIYIHNFIIWEQQLDISLGNIVTLITKDVYSFEQAIWMINDAWIGILQTFIVCYLLYRKIGLVSFVGIGVLLSVMPLQVFIGKYVSKLRLTTGKRTDERLQVTQETLSTIRIVKMYTWEKYFSERIKSARVEEVNKMLLGFYLKIIIVLLGLLFSKLGFYSLIMVYIWMGFATDAELVFYVLSLFKYLKQTLGLSIPYGMGRAAELYSAIVRINRVLVAEEFRPTTGSEIATSFPLVEMKDVVVDIKHVEVLRNITLRIDSGLTLVTGTVGSGKSSLPKTILQDCPLTSDYVIAQKLVTYNFGARCMTFCFRYHEVVRVCALEYDFRLFDKGDETIVTDRGLNLSKGQQARVNLARAIYKESEIYLLDDSLTALDAQVQDYIFDECIKKFLKGRICILVTQMVNHIKEADNVIVMDDGKIKSCEKPNKKLFEEISNLVSHDDDLEKEVIVDKEKEEDVEKNVEHEDEQKLLEVEQITNKKKVYGEINKKGEVDYQTYMKYIKFAGGLCLMLFNVLLFGVTQGMESYSESLLTKWVDQQNVVQMTITQLSASSGNDNFSIEHAINNNPELEQSIAREQFTIKLYSIMILLSTEISLVKTYTLFDFCRKASINIHKNMVKHITYAVMSFYDTHFIGNVLNRFSQDLNNVDEHLPFVFSECFRVTVATNNMFLEILKKYMKLLNKYCPKIAPFYFQEVGMSYQYSWHYNSRMG